MEKSAPKVHGDDLNNSATHFQIDGFRSLRDFDLRLSPGLNVLVGPNGSGKSNFIDFLDFLYVFLRGGAPLAVSRVGGISRVFSQENLKKQSPRLAIKIAGYSNIPETSRMNHFGYFKYEYSLELRYTRVGSTLYVKKEQLKFGRLRKSLAMAQKDNRYLGALCLSRSTYREDVQPKWYVSPKLVSRVPSNPLSASNRYFGDDRTAEGFIRKTFEQFPYEEMESDRSFLGEFPRTRIQAIDAVRRAMTRGRSFNISPGQARAPDDMSHPPAIDRDGAGLSAALYHLQLLRHGRPTRAGLVAPTADSETLTSIIEWTKLIYPQLQDISVHADHTSGKYISYLIIKGKTPLRIPLQSASDGTIKWLALVTLILGFGNAYSIEEPENFLHPKMQQFLVQLIRDSLSDSDAASYFLISTHSETLINECNPEELVVFDFLGQVSVARRIRDPAKVREEINSTGFGLGYYYANNAIS